MAKVLTGSRAKILVAGTEVAVASNINLNVEYTLQDIDVLNKIDVLDLAEVGHRVNFSINVFKPLDPALNITAKSLGLEQALENMKNQGVISVEIMGPDDVVMYKVDGVKYEGGSGTIDARGVWTGTWNFRGIKSVISETNPSASL